MEGQGWKDKEVMYRRTDLFAVKWIVSAMAAWLVGAAILSAQSAPSQEPFGGTPPVPAPSVPPLPATAGATTREVQPEQRILQLESMVNQFQYQVSRGGGVTAPAAGDEGESDLAPSEPGSTTTSGAAEIGGLPRQSVSRMGSIGVPGQSFPPVPPPEDRCDSPATVEAKQPGHKSGDGVRPVTALGHQG